MYSQCFHTYSLTQLVASSIVPAQALAYQQQPSTAVWDMRGYTPVWVVSRVALVTFQCKVAHSSARVLKPQQPTWVTTLPATAGQHRVLTMVQSTAAAAAATGAGAAIR
jgi:hypothetical protein